MVHPRGKRRGANGSSSCEDRALYGHVDQASGRDQGRAPTIRNEGGNPSDGKPWNGVPNTVTHIGGDGVDGVDRESDYPDYNDDDGGGSFEGSFNDDGSNSVPSFPELGGHYVGGQGIPPRTPNAAGRAGKCDGYDYYHDLLDGRVDNQGLFDGHDCDYDLLDGRVDNQGVCDGHGYDHDLLDGRSQ